jgi:hypothetical protein
MEVDTKMADKNKSQKEINKMRKTEKSQNKREQNDYFLNRLHTGFQNHKSDLVLGRCRQHSDINVFASVYNEPLASAHCISPKSTLYNPNRLQHLGKIKSDHT